MHKVYTTNSAQACYFLSHW